MVDDGSADGTWQVLSDLVASCDLPARAIRLASRSGPTVARNMAVNATHGKLIAFIDDDCIPEPSWLRRLVVPFAETEVTVAQGRTLPMEEAPAGAWDHTISVTAPSGLYETCNLACRRADFDAVGGFQELGLLSYRKWYGEDVMLGASLARRGRPAWAGDAVVRHRWLHGDFREHLRGRWRLTAFPKLVGLVPELRGNFFLGVFLSRRTAMFDVAIAGVATSFAARKATPLVAVAPWLLSAVHEGRNLPGRSVPFRVAQRGVGDLVGLAALLRGSLRHGHLIL